MIKIYVHVKDAKLHVATTFLLQFHSFVNVTLFVNETVRRKNPYSDHEMLLQLTYC